LRLWPNRSLPPRGFAAFILATFGMLMIPTLSLLGEPALWGVAPFTLGAVWLTWTLIRRNYRDGDLLETLTIARGQARLERRDPGGRRREWTANPYWVRVTLHKDGGPVENYLTLSGGDREVEIGAFLSPDERAALKPELESALSAGR
jgi:uncharacterized membrane protein